MQRKNIDKKVKVVDKKWSTLGRRSCREGTVYQCTKPATLRKPKEQQPSKSSSLSFGK